MCDLPSVCDNFSLASTNVSFLTTIVSWKNKNERNRCSYSFILQTLTSVIPNKHTVPSVSLQFCLQNFDTEGGEQVLSHHFFLIISLLPRFLLLAICLKILYLLLHFSMHACFPLFFLFAAATSSLYQTLTTIRTISPRKLHQPEAHSESDCYHFLLETVTKQVSLLPPRTRV